MPTTSARAEYVSMCRVRRYVPNTSVRAECVSVCRIKTADEFNTAEQEGMCRMKSANTVPCPWRVCAEYSARCRSYPFLGIEPKMSFWVISGIFFILTLLGNIITRRGLIFWKYTCRWGVIYIYGPLQRKLSLLALMEGHFQCNSVYIRIFPKGEGVMLRCDICLSA